MAENPDFLKYAEAIKGATEEAYNVPYSRLDRPTAAKPAAIYYFDLLLNNIAAATRDLDRGNRLDIFKPTRPSHDPGAILLRISDATVGGPKPPALIALQTQAPEKEVAVHLYLCNAEGILPKNSTPMFTLDDKKTTLSVEEIKRILGLFQEKVAPHLSGPDEPGPMRRNDTSGPIL